MADLSITAFTSAVQAKGFLDPTKYKVSVTSPIGWLGRGKRKYCSGVSIPGRSIGTVERFDHGPIRKVPYAEIVADLTMTFYCDKENSEFEYFDKWQRLVCGGNDFYLPYYDDIIGNIRLELFDRKGSLKARYEMSEAWPVTLGEIQLGYDQVNTIPTFQVMFAYHHWEKTY